VVVVEEPGEEPKLYRQDTGELVTPANSSFIDPVIHEENDEHPNELPKGKEKAKYPTSHSKLYKDIDELIENLITEDQNLKSKTFHPKQQQPASQAESSKLISDNIYNSNSYTSKQSSNSNSSSSCQQKEKIQKRYSFPPREDKDHGMFKKAFHHHHHHHSHHNHQTPSSHYNGSTTPKEKHNSEEKSPDNRRSGEKEIKNSYFLGNDTKRSTDTFSSSKSEKIVKECKNDLMSEPILSSTKSTNLKLVNEKKSDCATQRLIMSNHKLNKTDYSTTPNCHRSSSTRSVNRKLKFRVSVYYLFLLIPKEKLLV
jgi:hypothetical protein